MLCLNCGQRPRSTKSALPICDQCIRVGDELEALLKQGIEIEVRDPKTGKLSKHSYTSNE